MPKKINTIIETKNEYDSANIESHQQTYRQKWTKQEDLQLSQCLKMYGPKWLLIAEKMGHRNASQCSQRWKRIKKNHNLEINIEKRRWTEDEDKKLLIMYTKFGPRWKEIAKNIPNKNGRQVRSRYVNVLNPTLRHSPLTIQEDQKIWELYLRLGPQWSSIANQIPGRSENIVKNRFYTHIKVKYLNQPNLYYELHPYQKEQEQLQMKNFVTSIATSSHKIFDQEVLYSHDSMNIDSVKEEESCYFDNEQSMQCLFQRFK